MFFDELETLAAGFIVGSWAAFFEIDMAIVEEREAHCGGGRIQVGEPCWVCKEAMEMVRERATDSKFSQVEVWQKTTMVGNRGTLEVTI